MNKATFVMQLPDGGKLVVRDEFLFVEDYSGNVYTPRNGVLEQYVVDTDACTVWEFAEMLGATNDIPTDLMNTILNCAGGCQCQAV